MARTTTVLFIADLVGKPGVYCVKSLLGNLRRTHQVDLTIANCDGATGGFGLGKRHAAYLHKLGVDVITSGECIYYKRDMVPYLKEVRYVLRPFNYPRHNPGNGWATVTARGGARVTVACLLGQSGYDRVHAGNPFAAADWLASERRAETPITILDFHACTTAEKRNMCVWMDGKVSAVFGTHVRVQSADEAISAKGTATLTHCGRTGSIDSVGGLDPEIEIRKWRTGIYERSADTWSNLQLQGALARFDDEGRAVALERLQVPCPTPAGTDEQTG
ncbi:MAG: TIGR00282 family metallophosphoesterase [Spirochaetaceae bacterium]|nr:TIGR00282 family metallophosphoesterase [Spirochaetaceae bacterium]